MNTQGASRDKGGMSLSYLRGSEPRYDLVYICPISLSYLRGSELKTTATPLPLRSLSYLRGSELLRLLEIRC